MTGLQVFEFGPPTDVRPAFLQRFAGIDPCRLEPFIRTAEALLGDNAARDIVEGVLDVAESRLNGIGWEPDEAIAELDEQLPLQSPRDPQHPAWVLAHLGQSERAESGRAIVIGSVYCVQGARGGPIKIGFSQDVDRRLASLNTSHPEPLLLLTSCRAHDFVEKDLHGLLAEHRIRGEWFTDAPEVRHVVANLRSFCDSLESARPQDTAAEKK